jgi:hypothetical protein
MEHFVELKEVSTLIDGDMPVSETLYREWRVMKVALDSLTDVVCYKVKRSEMQNNNDNYPPKTYAYVCTGYASTNNG